MNLFGRKFLEYGTFALVFLVPIAYFNKMVYPFITSKTFLFYGLISVLFFHWIYLLITENSYRLTKKQLFCFIPVFAYIIWMTIAGIVAVNPHLSFWSSLGRGTGLLTWYCCILMGLIITSLINHNGIKYVYSLLKWFLYSSCIVALTLWMGSDAFSLYYGFLIGDGGGGITGNSSLAAAYLIFALFFLVFILFSGKISRNQKFFISGIFSLIICSPLFFNFYGLIKGIGLLGSARGAILGVLVGIGSAVLGYTFISKNKIARNFGIIGILISLVLFSISWYQFMKPDSILNEKFTEVASGTRFLFWEVAQESINKHPYFGYGPENYMIAFQENFNPKILNKELGHEAWNDRAHNIYFDTGVSGGYPAILFYFIFLCSFFYIVFGLYKKESISRIQTSVLWGLVVAYIFQNLFYFDSVLSCMSLFVLFGIVCGMYGSNNKEFTKNKEIKNTNLLKNKNHMVLLGATLFLLCFGSVVYFSLLPAYKSFKFGIILNLPVSERASHYQELLKGSSVGDDWDVGGFAHDLYRFYAIAPRGMKNNKKMLPVYQKDLSAFLEYLEVIAKENPNDFRLYKKIFDLYNTSIFLSDKVSDPALTEHLFEILDHARTLSQTNPEIYWGVAQLHAWSGDFKGIEQAYKQAIAIGPSVVASHKLLIKFAQNISNQKLYNEAIIQAEKDIPGFIVANQKELNIEISKETP